MPLNIHVYLHGQTDLQRTLQDMNNKIDELTAQVKANHDAIESAKVLINGIADRIAAAGADQGKLDSLIADLKAEDESLSEAVAANTAPS